MRCRRVLLLAPVVRDASLDTDLSSTIPEIQAALTANDPRREVIRVDVEKLADVVRAVRHHAPDVVFNACETVDGKSEGEPLVPRVLDRLGVAYTGSSASCLTRCLRKTWASEVLRSVGVSVPPTFEGEVGRGAFPVIVKPEREDGSVGIDDGSVVFDAAGLARARAALSQRGQAAFVQGYVDGREIAVALLGWPEPRVLSPGEILYDESRFEGRAKILTYASKWDPASVDYLGTRSVGAELDSALLGRAAAIARRAASALGIRDYGRIDLRVDGDGRPFVIDANPNCDLSSGGGFMLAAARSGLSYADAIEGILAGASARALETPAVQCGG